MNEFLSREPKDCKIHDTALSTHVKGATAWYYEERHGFTVVVRVRENEYVHIEISWRTILASVGRYLKSKGKKIV
jgi:hypothetical protein